MTGNDQQNMDEFFLQMKQPKKSQWTTHYPDLSVKDQKKFDQSDIMPTLTLDLHGRTTAQATDQTDALIRFGREHQHRLILIIHGIGSSQLRNTVTQILTDCDDILYATNKHAGKTSMSRIWVWLKR